MPEIEHSGATWDSTFRDERLRDERLRDERHYVFEPPARELAGRSGKEIPSRVRR